MTTRHAHNVFSIFALFALIVFCCFTDQDKALASASGFSVSAVQGNITNGKLNVSKGDKVDLIVNANGSAITAKSAKYKSSNKRIATVSRSGRIKAKKKGSAVITVSYKGAVSKVKVRVKTSKITLYNSTNGFNLSLNTAQMRPSSFRLKVKYKNKKTVKTPKVTFSSSNPAVATVDNKGVVTLKAPGVVTIKAKYKKKTGKCTIHVTRKNTSGTHSQTSSYSTGSSGGSGRQTVTPVGGTDSSGSTGGSSGNSGSTGSSTPSGGTTTEPEYVQETEPKYTYKLEFANKTALCTGWDCILHVITDNPDLYDSSEGLATANISYVVDGEGDYGNTGLYCESVGTIVDNDIFHPVMSIPVFRGRPSFDDIKYIEENRVSDGYIVCFAFEKPGYHTIAIKEKYYQYDASSRKHVYEHYVDTNAKITFNVLDGAVSEKKFYNKMLQQFRGANDKETLENITVYLRNNLKYQSYYVNGSGSITRKLNLLANYGPWWMTFKDITCYTTTAIMCKFAEQLGYESRWFNPGLRGKDHRLAWVYFDKTIKDEEWFDPDKFYEDYMGSYDACPIGTNNNYTYDTFKYLYS